MVYKLYLINLLFCFKDYWIAQRACFTSVCGSVRRVSISLMFPFLIYKMEL